MVKFVEVLVNKMGYMELREIFINPVQVVALKMSEQIIDDDVKNALGLDTRVELTEIYLANGTHITVAGSAHVVQANLGARTKQLLRG